MKSLLTTILCGLICLDLSAQIGYFIKAPDGQLNDYFGRAVDISGDFAIVGTHGDDFLVPPISEVGSAYLIKHEGNEWVFKQKISPGNKKAGTHFGYSVAIDSNVAVIGAVSDGPPGIETGAVYIFAYNGSTWTEITKLIPSDGQANDFFGFAVDIDGPNVIVGAPNADGGGTHSGAVYFYQFNGTSWVEKQKVLPSDSFTNGFYGCAVSMSGSRAVVGAPVFPNPGTAPGQAYVIAYDGSTWNEEQIITPSDATNKNNFGQSVDIDNDQIIATSPFLSTFTAVSTAAYIFSFNGTTWIQQQQFSGSNNPGTDKYGIDAAIEGDLAVVGAYLEYDGSNRGVIYVYKKTNGAWSIAGKVSPGNLYDNVHQISKFGNPLALSGTTCISGAVADSLAQSDEGSAFIMELATPVNDECIGSLPISCGETILTSTVFAIHSDAPGNCASGPFPAPGLWYTFTGTGDNITASLCGSDFNTRIMVFLDACDDSLRTCVASNDDVCDVQSSVAFPSDSGELYYIYISGYDTAKGNFQFSIECDSSACNVTPVAFTDKIGLNTARINWSPVPGALEYEVTSSITGSTEKVFTLPGSFNKLVIYSLSPGVSYTWKVRAICDPAETIFSPYSNTEVFSTPSMCFSPTNLSTGPVISHAARLQWNAVPGASKYRIFGDIVGSAPPIWIIDVFDPLATHYDVYGLDSNTSYHWTIISHCGPNISPIVEIDTFTTLGNVVTNKTQSASMIPDELTIYPNPAGDYVNIAYLPSQESEQIKVEIFDLNGQSIFIRKEENKSGKLTIPLPAHLANGVYQLKIDQGGRQQSERMVILR